MKEWQVRKFYEDKENADCPLTEELIKSGYRQDKDGYIDYAIKNGIGTNYKKAEPSQWWHLIHSWCDRSTNATFGRSITCGELLFWMAEVSGAFSNDELIKLTEVVLNKTGNLRYSRGEKEGLIKSTAAGNLIIQDYCFDRIEDAVMSNVDGYITQTSNLPKTYSKYAEEKDFGEEELKDKTAEFYYNWLAAMLNQFKIIDPSEFEDTDIKDNIISAGDLTGLMELYVSKGAKRTVANRLTSLVEDEIFPLGPEYGFLWDIVIEMFLQI